MSARIDDLLEKRSTYLSPNDLQELFRLLIEDYKRRKESEVNDEPTPRAAEQAAR